MTEAHNQQAQELLEAATKLNSISNKLRNLEREISGFISNTSDRLATDLLRLQDGNLNMTTLSNADKRNRLDEAYDLKERVEQRAQGSQKLAWRCGESALEHMMGEAGDTKSTTRSKFAGTHVEVEQESLNDLLDEWEALQESD